MYITAIFGQGSKRRETPFLVLFVNPEKKKKNYQNVTLLVRHSNMSKLHTFSIQLSESPQLVHEALLISVRKERIQ